MTIPEPNLGCATTAQLLNEIEARLEVDAFNAATQDSERIVGDPHGVAHALVGVLRKALTAEQLAYRTVGS